MVSVPYAVWIVEPEESVRRYLQAAVAETNPYATVRAFDREAVALDSLRSDPTPDLFLVNVAEAHPRDLPELISKLIDVQHEQPHAGIVLLSTMPVLCRLVPVGAFVGARFDFLDKPHRFEELQAIVQRYDPLNQFGGSVA